MCAHVLSNLLDELGKRDKMRYFIFFFFATRLTQILYGGSLG